jgi:hypothetical protein
VKRVWASWTQGMGLGDSRSIDLHFDKHRFTARFSDETFGHIAYCKKNKK